jgi:hypothetical protein
MTALFDAVDYPATPAPHACSGDVCQVCQLTRTSAAAKTLGTLKPKRDHGWWAEATRWLDRQPLGLRFTADDLVDAIGLPHGTSNQVGAAIRTWAVQDLIDPVGYTEATRHSSHGRVLRIWQVAR